jgi:repressor LexA
MFFVKLESLRKKSGKLQKDVAKAIGVGRTTYAMYEQGNREPNFEMLEKIASYFKVQPDYFFNETETLNVGIPLIGTICAGDGFLATQNIEEYILYPFPNREQPDYALHVKGDSMKNAGIDDGDIVFMKKADWFDFNGQIVAAIINDGEEGALKRIKSSDNSTKYLLVPENDKYETRELIPGKEFTICGTYRGHFKPDMKTQ